MCGQMRAHQSQIAASRTTSVRPLLSIVTVCLNAAHSIDDTLASVAGQRGGVAIEHLCIDGGSRDGTRSIIDAAAGRYGHISRIYEADAGIYDAMNKGLAAARGDYVLYLNADDVLASADVLCRCMEGIVPGSAGNPDLILGDVIMGHVGQWGPWRHRRVPRLLLHHTGTGLFPVHQGRIVRRDLLLQVQGFDAGSRLAADVTQYYDLERLSPLRCRFVQVPIAHMRPGGAANSGLPAMWRGTREIFAHLREVHGPLRSAGMTAVKTLQSLSELRIGRCPGERWFAR